MLILSVDIRSFFLNFCKRGVSAVQGHPRPLILVPIESVYATSYYIYYYSNVSPTLHRFTDIAGFCAHAHDPTPPLFHPILGVFPLDQIGDVGLNRSRYLKLFGREIIFDVFQPV